jgi:hypothetical protein
MRSRIGGDVVEQARERIARGLIPVNEVFRVSIPPIVRMRNATDVCRDAATLKFAPKFALQFLEGLARHLGMFQDERTTLQQAFQIVIHVGDEE